jgi:putative tricarboxylic transport membrane protein
MRKKVDFYTGLFWVLFSLVTCIEAYRLKLGDIHQPGLGFFPFWTGIIMGILSLLVLFQSIREKETKDSMVQYEPFGSWNIIAVLAILTAFFLSLEKVGFLINTFLFIGIMLKLVYFQSWRTTILGALGTAIAAQLLFNVLLKAQIPSGILGF